MRFKLLARLSVRCGITVFFLSLCSFAHQAAAAATENGSGPGSVLDELYPPIIIRGQSVSKTALTDRMAELHVPGISVAVIRDGKLAWAKGFGVTRKNGAAISTDTLFQAGSVSKLLTAMAVLHLVQEGKLNLDSDVNLYLKSWKVPDNAFTKRTKVTLRMLLSHTGGISSGVEFYPRHTASLPTITQILRNEKPAKGYTITVDSPPGKAWRYANGGYDIIEQVLEDVSGRPFADFMRDTVLEPLGLKHSSYEEPLPESRLAEAATAHDVQGTPVVDGPISIPEEAAGGLWTTPSDLALVVMDLQQALAGTAKPVINQAMAREMTSPGLNDWGLGCQVEGHGKSATFGHGGDTTGFHTELMGFKRGDGYVYMSNGDGGYDLEGDVVRTLAQAYAWQRFRPVVLPKVAAVDPAVLRRYTGQYRIHGFKGGFAVLLAGGRLSVVPGPPDHSLVLDHDQTFVSKEMGTVLTFVTDGHGKTLGALLTLPNGMHLTASRADTVYRHADPGARVPEVRPFLDLSKDGTLGDKWCDGATLTARIKSGQIEYVYDSGPRWGCDNFFFSNVGPFVAGQMIDLRGYDYLRFKALVPDKVQFLIHLSEAGSDKPDAKVFKGLNGTDGESYVSFPLTGTGKWETYTVDLTSLELRPEWGNQHGNHVLDLQAIACMDFVIAGNQGKGKILVKDLDFRSYPR